MNTDAPRVGAKDFFLWFGAMVSLYWSVFAFVSLIFSYLNYAMPDALSYYTGDPYSAGISYEMASLVVMFPVFLFLMRVIRGDIDRDPSRGQIWVRRWALVLTLFIAGVALAGDLITLVQYFFNGDVTTRFVLKVLVVLLVAGGGFLHFYADLRGYWDRNVSKAKMVGYAVLALGIVSVIAGFFIVGSPMQARGYRFDEQKANDLMGIQGQVISYWQTKQKLPAALTDLNDPISGYLVPSDPQTGAPYEFAQKSPTSFELCATFNAATQPYAAGGRTVPMGAPYGAVDKFGYPQDVWQHSAGRTCYERTIDPERYPFIKR